LAGDPRLSAAWRDRANKDIGDPQFLAALLLKCSAAMNPGGSTVFSSTNEDRIRKNVMVFRDSQADPSGIRELISNPPAPDAGWAELAGVSAHS